MDYVKSVLAGVLALGCGIVLSLIVLVVRLNEPIHVSLRLRSPIIWGFLLILFLAGFIWEFWRLRMHGH
jgi:hypothetical protein